jgi:hypothetical protein
MMKTTNLIASIAAAAILCGSATILTAQDATAACPFGHEPGYGRSLTPEQQSAHRAAVRQLMAELRQKQADGTVTAEEQTWLQQAMQRGGMCITGTPRGPGTGKGQGLRNGQGQGQGKGQGLRNGQGLGRGQGLNNGQGRGMRQGPRDGTGPRSVDGTCPDGNSPRGGGRR